MFIISVLLLGGKTEITESHQLLNQQHKPTIYVYVCACVYTRARARTHTQNTHARTRKKKHAQEILAKTRAFHLNAKSLNLLFPYRK